MTKMVNKYFMKLFFKILVFFACDFSLGVIPGIATIWGRPSGTMFKELDFGLEICKFKLQLFYYVHIRTNIFGKGINPLISIGIGQIASLLFFNKDDLGIN